MLHGHKEKSQRLHDTLNEIKPLFTELMAHTTLFTLSLERLLHYAHSASENLK